MWKEIKWAWKDNKRSFISYVVFIIAAGIMLMVILSNGPSTW